MNLSLGKVSVCMKNHELYDDFYLYYDHIFKDREAERAYFRRQLSPHDSVLEVACGTGTLTTDFAAICTDVVGIDISEAMLGLARERLPGVTFHCCDMRNFHLGRQFSRVICGYNSLMHMLSDHDVVAALSRFKAHCLPSGEVILDLIDMNPSLVLPQTVALPVMDMIDPVSGIHLCAVENSTFDFETRVLMITLCLFDGNTRQLLKMSSSPLRLYSPSELATLISAAGLEVTRIETTYGVNSTKPYNQQIVYARPTPVRGYCTPISKKSIKITKEIA